MSDAEKNTSDETVVSGPVENEPTHIQNEPPVIYGHNNGVKLLKAFIQISETKAKYGLDKDRSPNKNQDK